jgi:spore coat protein U-like protein
LNGVQFVLGDLMRKSFVLAGIALVTFGTEPVLAVDDTANFNATLTIEATCDVLAPNPLAFGTAGVLSAIIDTTANFTVQCTNTTAYIIKMNEGTNGTAVTDRKMQLAAATIDYEIYRNAGRTENWGETSGSDTVSGTGDGTAVTYTMYGRCRSNRHLRLEPTPTLSP